MYNPLVSVVINNYNYAKFLPEAIESVLNQTYRNFELIIVDDGSTDNSREIIDRYCRKHSKIIIPIYKKNGGQASVFNKGFEASNGEIICFLDSDDYWFPEKIEKVLKHHKSYGFVQHNLKVNGQKEFSNLISNQIDWSMLLRNYGYDCAFNPTSGLSLNHDIADKVFPIPTDGLEICADVFVRLNALYHSNMFSINEALGYYRVHGNNNWTNTGNTKHSAVKMSEIKRLLNEKLVSAGLDEIPSNMEFSYTDFIVKSLNMHVHNTFLVYGTGSLSEKFTEHIKQQGKIVAYYSDSNSEKWNKAFMDRPVVPPESINDIRQAFDRIIIASTYAKDILPNLEKMGLYLEKDILVSPTLLS